MSGLPELPPRAQLRRVVGSVVEALQADFGEVLAAEALAELGRAVVALGTAEARDRALADIGEEEARWLAEALQARWSRLGPLVLPAAVAILGPDELWMGATPRTVPLALSGAGIREVAAVRWTGHAQDREGERIELSIGPPLPDELRVGVRAEVRLETGRAVLTAEHRIRIRRMEVAIDAPRNRLAVRDQHGRPGGGLPVVIGGRTHRTEADGRLVLPAPMAAGERIEVGGVTVET